MSGPWRLLWKPICTGLNSDAMLSCSSCSVTSPSSVKTCTRVLNINHGSYRSPLPEALNMLGDTYTVRVPAKPPHMTDLWHGLEEPPSSSHLQLMTADIPLLVPAFHSSLLNYTHLVASQLHHPAG